MARIHVGFVAVPSEDKCRTGASPAWTAIAKQKEKTPMKELNETMERTVVICAEKPTVFRYFTDSKRFADWMGAGSTIEGKPGGQIRICYPGVVISSGPVLEI